MTPGAAWEQEIEKQFGKAQLILLFISSTFLASKHPHKIGIQQAIVRHERKEARVIPILLTPVHWEEPPIANLQPLPDSAKPIAKWRPPDEGYKNVAEGIKRVVDQWNAQSLPGLSAERKAFMAEFEPFVEAVRVQLQPPPRAVATANSLQQLGTIIPFGVMLSDIMAGWQILSHPPQREEKPVISQSQPEEMHITPEFQPEEAPNISRRRITCSELAMVASQFTTDQGHLEQAIKTWSAWQEAFKNSSDARQQAMAETFARELFELQEAAR